MSPARAGAENRRAAGAASPMAQQPGFFVLRTPLLPIATVTEWSHGLEAPARAADPAALDDAIASDRLRLRSRLAEIVTEPGVREAIFVASPSLEGAIESWHKDPDSERGQRAEQALVAYLMRAATRPTPFGLFAGCTTGSIGARTRLRLHGRDRFRRYTRLDMDYLWALAKAIEADPWLRADLRYWPNSSRYEIGDRLMYAEARDSAAGRSYHLVAVDQTPYLMQILARARDGERLDVLAGELTSDDITEAEARDYLGELIDSQLLIPDSQPQVTGAPPAGAMAATLASHPATAAIGTRLYDALAGLAAIDAGGVGASPEAYRRLAGHLGGLPASPDPSRFVQVDLIKPPVEATLGTAVTADILRGVQVLHSLSRQPADGALARFREQFTRRYETRELPLAQVLDEETGIGFWTSGQTGSEGAPLLAGLPLQPHPDSSQSWTRRDAFLHRKLGRAIADGRSEISIDADEADVLRSADHLPLPGAFEVLAAVVAESDEGIDHGDYQVVIGSAGGPSGARLLGRFCHADDGLRQLAQAHLEAEELTRPDCVFAEIVHLPQGRTGNILSRPVLRRYEIPYLGRSGAMASGQLPVSDLMVSVQGERIVLRSQALGREVMPRLTAAHNYAQGGLAVYRFLCALQNQDVTPGVMWDWGPLRDSPFLPRVISGRTVLSRMTWNLGEPELAAFRLPRGGAQFGAVQQLRARLRLPRYVALADVDNELVTDLDNVLCVEALGHQVRRRTVASLVELIPGPGQLCVSSPQGPYTHQVVVPFVWPGPAQPARPSGLAAVPAIQHAAGAVERRFPPGSEWLYLKLFTGPATADQVLLRAAPLLAASAHAGIIDSWHFVRYGDPDWHIRLRLHGSPEVLLGDLLPRLRDLTEPLLRTGQIWRTQLDTYERELERYGGSLGIGPAERIFHGDSQAVVEIISQLPGDAGADLRWRMALRGIDQVFDDFGLTLAQKREIARRCRQGYGREFGAGSSFQHAVSARFRRERPWLEFLLSADPPPEVTGCVRALDDRSAAIATAAGRIRAVADSEAPNVPGLAELATSFAHMHVNRLLRSAQRAQELVLYEMLDRLYTSRAAREAG
jgi:thiopeptide-type bacteriocin biosynthesis protein